MGRELDKVLDSHEKVLWEGKPRFWPFFIGGASMSIFIGLFLLIFPIIGWVLGPVFIIGGPIYRALVYNFTYYAITNKRVIFQKGLIGRDFTMADYDQITNAEVNVGVLDKLLFQNTGSIYVYTAGTFRTTKNGTVPAPYVLSHIHFPYEVFKFFKKVSHAVKTDISYPNQKRPRHNPGYQTEYRE